MNVWNVRFDVLNFASSCLVGEEDLATGFCAGWPDFDGQEVRHSWQNFKAEIKTNKPIGNFTDLDPGVLICDSFALSKLEKRIETEVEVLPISFISKIEMHVLNVTSVIDCLDEEKSDIKYFENSKDVMSIKKYKFAEELLENVLLFKIPQLNRTEIFATDSFRELITGSFLTGLNFKLVYS
jgi:hypothetical protein